MPRLGPQTFDTLDDDQRALWTDITTGPRANPEREHGGLTGADGALIGPFNALFLSPQLGNAIQQLGAAVRYNNALPADLLEVAICTMGGHWRANFEFWAHARLARNAGVSGEAIDAIRDGDVPNFSDERQQAVYQFGRELIETQRVSDQTYETLSDMIGEQGVFEIASVMGYYALVSIGLNTFNVAMPPGVEAPFAD